MNVLSLFDGISCGRVALERAGVPVTKYYASEVDKYAIKVALKNYPDTIQLGDVKNVWARNLPKIDLLMGGSPCQDLSIAKAGRKGLNGERSSLFWHYVRLLRTCKPKYFLLENVASMPKPDRDIISRELGVEPVLINSALVSAQQRKRLYWTNIPNVTQPQDRGIVLKDILEQGVAFHNKAYSLKARYDGATVKHLLKRKMHSMEAVKVLNIHPSGKGINGNVYSIDGKSATLTTNKGEGQEIIEPKRLGGFYGQHTRWGIFDEKGKAPCITASCGLGGGHTPMVPERIGEVDGKTYQANRIYSVRGKSISLNGNDGGMGANTGLYKIDLPDGDYIIRKLTPVECERLQTLPDNYTEGISNTQRYKCLGNGWTVDVIAHIFKGLTPAR